MKRVLSVLFVLLFVAALAPGQDGRPNMVIDQETFDAGVVVRTGAPIEHAFRIKNTGNGELRIFDVKPG